MFGILPKLVRNNATRTTMSRVAGGGAIRQLNVHEYISMETMNSHGIATPECHATSTADEAGAIVNEMLSRTYQYHPYSHI